MPTATKSKKRTKKTETTSEGREVLYPEVTSTVCRDDSAVTAEQAKEVLGWTEPPENDKFSPDYTHLKDIHGRTIHNVHTTQFQRKYYKSQYESLMWDILSGQWYLNGDVVTIGQTGWVLDGKHRLVALVLAVQEYHKNPERYPYWHSRNQEPTIDVVMVYGIEERKEIVNTIGTGKVRTLADSIFASGLFETSNRKDCAALCRMLEYAVRMLWQRTGARDDAYSPKASHSDALEFVERHPSLLHCVKVIFDEDGKKDKRISRYLSPGAAAGLLYLMGASGSDPDPYRDSLEPSEETLSFDRMEKAEEFFVLLSGGDTKLKPVHNAVVRMNEEGNLQQSDRIATVIKAWNKFVSNKKVTKRGIDLQYDTDDMGARHLVEDPTVGGIDIGKERQ